MWDRIITYLTAMEGLNLNPSSSLHKAQSCMMEEEGREEATLLNIKLQLRWHLLCGPPAAVLVPHGEGPNPSFKYVVDHQGQNRSTATVSPEYREHTIMVLK